MGSVNYVSLSMATALQRSMDATAHNLANASTAGFKTRYALFESVDSGSSTNPDESVNYVQDRGQYVDTSQGMMIPSGNPLDVAVSGAGWLAYEAENGETAYGRDGRLTILPDGQLATLTGAPVLDVGGAPITLPGDVGQDVVIARDGTITDRAGARLGQIGIFAVTNPNDMIAIGNGMFLPSANGGEATAIEDAQIVQGFVEQSNVQPVIEMTRMMDIQRAYEQATKIMSDRNELTEKAIQRLGRVV